MFGDFSSARALLALFSCVFVFACSSPVASVGDSLMPIQVAPALDPVDLSLLGQPHGPAAKNCMSCHSGTCPDRKAPGVAVFEAAPVLDARDRNLCKRYPDLCCPGCAAGVAPSAFSPAARVDKT